MSRSKDPLSSGHIFLIARKCPDIVPDYELISLGHIAEPNPKPAPFKNSDGGCRGLRLRVLCLAASVKEFRV